MADASRRTGHSGSTFDDENRREKPKNNDNEQSYNDQYDDEDECWDDAKALLNNEDDTTAQHQFDTIDGEIATSAEPSSQPASSSSAYSSLQSSNHSNSNPSSTPQSLRSISAPLASAADDLILHEAVFNNGTEKILAILNDVQFIKQRDLVNKRDKHGNTALHLACMMGRPKEIISAFLQNKSGCRWSIDTKNLNRWTPFHEACSYGNREAITLMVKQLKDDVDDALHNSKLSDFLEKTKDYRLVLRWEFQSWVPFVSRVLPSDVCVINKQGKFIRVDTRLLDFDGLFRKKGDSCLVYSDKKWIVMNNKTKKYQYFETPAVYKDVDDKIDEFMSTDIMDLELNSSEMQMTRSTSGWIWKAQKVGKVGRFNAALYDFTNVFLVTRKRREHLSDEDIKRNKIAYRSAVHVFKFGEKPPNQDTDANQVEGEKSDGIDLCGDQGSSGGEQEDESNDVIHRESLLPPPPTSVTWQEYIESEPGNHPNLGREQKCKVVRTAVKASVAMSEEFPLTKKEFLDLLSVVPIKMFKRLKEFVEMKQPDGFPVRLDIPVFPFLTARITFEDFSFHQGPVNESLFKLPPDYERDSNLLPGRFNGDSNTQSESHNTNT